MTKKKLRRLLRECRDEMALADELTWHSEEELKGEQALRVHLEGQLVEARERMAAMELSFQRAMLDAHQERERADELRGELAKARRRIGPGGFTLVRDVNGQTERMLAESRAQVRELEAENYALRYPPGEPEPDFDPADEDGCPMPPPPEHLRIGPGDVVYITDREGGSLVRVEVEALVLHGVHGQPIEVVINPRPGRAP